MGVLSVRGLLVPPYGSASKPRVRTLGVEPTAERAPGNAHSARTPLDVPFRAAALLFLASMLWFGAGIERKGLASGWCDPVSRIGAQDEAVYAREALGMVQSGDWLTPMYLGRFTLNKPPLLQWLAAASVYLFGFSAWAVRVPSLIAASLTVAAVFLLVRRQYSLPAALGAALLLVSNRLFYDFARLAMTDMLLVFWTTAAVVFLAFDPALRSRFSFWAFAVCAGAGILTKGAAGVLPLLALVVFTAVGPKQLRPRAGRAIAALAAAAAVSLPWHIYQVAVHSRWFIADYILTQHVSIGVTAPPQYSNENHLVFYARRLWLADPVLSLAALASVPLVWRNRRKSPVLLTWLMVLLAALFSFRYRAAAYLLPVLPVLAVTSGAVLAAIPRRLQTTALAALLACTVLKAAVPGPTWAIPAGDESQVAMAPGLRRYCEQRRGNDLILIAAADQFYASALPLARVRYVFPPPQTGARRPPLDYTWLGIALPAADFNRLAELRPLLRDRLARFGLHSGEALGTVIWAQSAAELAGLIEAHPDADFWLPAGLLRRLAVISPHTVKPDGPEGVYLLSPKSVPNHSGGDCQL